jgi:hypothetical protein
MDKTPIDSINLNIASTYTLCKTKIKRNDEIISLLELDNKICKLELVLCYRKIKNNVNRIKKINEINEIERKQIYDYTFERNKVIEDMTAFLNQMDNNITDLKIERDELIKQMYIIGDHIKLINNSLPNTIFIGPEKQIAVQEHEKRCLP